jgi:hypothetical protein
MRRKVILTHWGKEKAGGEKVEKKKGRREVIPALAVTRSEGAQP